MYLTLLTFVMHIICFKVKYLSATGTKQTLNTWCPTDRREATGRLAATLIGNMAMTTSGVLSLMRTVKLGDLPPAKG